VVSIKTDGEDFYYKSYHLKDLIDHDGSWEKVSLTYSLPNLNAKENAFSIYLWNNDKVEIDYDDFSFSLY